MVVSTWLFKILESYCNSKLVCAINCPVLRLQRHYWVPDKTGSFVINWWCSEAGLWHFLLLSSLISLHVSVDRALLSVPCPVHRLLLSSSHWRPMHFCPSVDETHTGCANNLGDIKKNPVAKGWIAVLGDLGGPTESLHQPLRWTAPCLANFSWLHWPCWLTSTN